IRASAVAHRQRCGWRICPRSGATPATIRNASQPDRQSQQNCEIREAALASHEPPDRILPTLLKALERVLAGGLHVVPGGLVGVPDLLKKLACLLGVGLQLSDAALVLGARLHARLPYLRLIFLDLRLPGIDLVLQLFRKVLLQSHEDSSLMRDFKPAPQPDVVRAGDFCRTLGVVNRARSVDRDLSSGRL